MDPEGINKTFAPACPYSEGTKLCTVVSDWYRAEGWP